MIDMQVRGDAGDVIARAACGVDWAVLLPGLDQERFPMLGALDPCGDAVFNHRQIPALLAELGGLPAERGGAWVEEVRDLCLVVQQAPHRYLWFVGD